MQNEQARIVPLDELDDYEVAEGDPDVRGWGVFAVDGTKIGEVEDLLVDTAVMKVRYIDVELDKKVSRAEDRTRHVLVPVGAARLYDEDDRVILNLSAGDAVNLPDYSRESFSREYETSLRQRLDRGFRPSGQERDYYAHEHYDDRRFYGKRGETRITRAEEELAVGKRPVQAGEVGIRKRVETEDVSVPVTRRREEVEIERRPVQSGQEAEIGEDQLRVPVMEEEVVVEKRPVVKEEIVVRKRTVEEEDEVREQVRKERIDVDEQGRQRQQRKNK
jgi:uncharacterized protein (TIGR02271 family)